MPPTQVGPYAIERELGRGGMGVVYAGRHLELGRVAAIKLISSDLGPEGRLRFQRECEALARLNHPGIVRVYDSGVAGAFPYVALELVEGAPLDEALAADGPWEEARALKLGIGICEAIQYAHECSILHRDLKPANILLDAQGRPQVTDFGLAKDLDAKSMTATGALLGTPSYMPPEQAGGERALVGPASDVYGIGATLYEVLTGHAPFEGSIASVLTQLFTKPPPAPRSLRPDLDPALEAILLRCLEKAPSDRYPSAAALAEDLASCLRGEAEAPPRSRWPLAAALLAVLVLATAGGGVFLLAQPAPALQTPTPPARSLERQAADAWHRAKSSADYKAWIDRFGDQAPPARRRRAQARLAEATWKDLEERVGPPRPGTKLPATAEIGIERLRRHRAVWAWAKDHYAHAPPPLAKEVNRELDGLRQGRILTSLQNVQTGPARQNALFDARGRIHLYGTGTQGLIFNPEGETEELAVLGVDSRVYRLRLTSDESWSSNAQSIHRRSSAGLKRASISNRLELKDFLVLDEVLILVGQKREAGLRPNDSNRGFAAVLPKSALRKGRPPKSPLNLLHLEERAMEVLKHPTREAFYVVGGTSNVEIGAGYLVCLERSEGGFREASRVVLPAPGLSMDLTPARDGVIVGMLRGGAWVFPFDSKGELDPTRSAVLVPEGRGSGETPVGPARVYVPGTAPLPSGGILISSNLHHIQDGVGFISAWSPESLTHFQTRDERLEAKTPSSEWVVAIPGLIQRISISPDRSLVVVGSMEGRVHLLPGPNPYR